mgnify:CR=1 FL=1
MNYSFLLIFIIFLISFEIFLIVLVNYFKKDFKWLLNSKDEKPKFNKNRLKKFYKNTFDSKLGWDRKKNFHGYENSSKKTFFYISKKGNRGISKFKSTKISVFGDSFAFCRYVNDNKTWQSFVEKKIKSNVKNFGVGNYGLDQSYLKYLKYKKKLKNQIIIFNFVPETIARINSYWKHYREFGNIYGFKPILEIQGRKAKILKIKIKKNYTEKQIYNQLNYIKKKDIFYKLKFKENIFKFPYSLTYFKSISFFSGVFLYLIANKLKKNKKFFNNAISMYFKKNIYESHDMYKKEKLSKKLEKLILFMNNEFSKKNIRMILIITPQLLDLQSSMLKNYLEFYENLSKQIFCLDLTKNFINNKNYRKYYLSDIYGGHLNEKGNKFISSIIYKFLKNKKLL